MAGLVTNVGLLNSILRCKACDSTMYYIYSKKGANKYHYYLCMNAQKRGYKSCPTRLISAQAIENKFMEFLRTVCKDPRIEAKAWESLTLEEKIPALRSIAKVAHYDAINGTLEIVLHKADKGHHPSTRSSLRSSLAQDGPEQASEASAPKGQFALKLAELKHIPYHRQQAEISKEPLIRQNLILAHQIDQIVHEKRCTLKEIAGWIGISPARICHIATMLLISPRIQEEILLSDNKALSGIPEYKLRDITQELDWNKQQDIWKNLLKSQQN